MKVKKSRLLDLYEALGVDSARDNWDDAKLAQKTNKDEGITRFRDPGQKIEDPELETLYDEIVKAREAGESIEVDTEGEEQSAPKPAKASVKEGKAAGADPKREPKPAPKAKPAAKKAPAKTAPVKKDATGGGGRQRYEGHGTWEAYKAHLAKNPKDVGDKGVIAETFKILKQAGKEKKPVTKEQILEVLKAKFRDREHNKLATTLNNNVPGRLKWMYGIHVWHDKNDDSTRTYYIDGDGRTPQPKGDKAAPKEKAETPAKTDPKKPAPAKTAAKKPAKKIAPKKKAGAGKK
jgi:hypothetical protein